MDINTIIVMICVSAVSILIGYVLMTQMETTAMPSMAHSVLSTSGEVVLGGFGQASILLAIGLFVIAAVFIVMILGSTLGKEE